MVLSSAAVQEGFPGHDIFAFGAGTDSGSYRISRFLKGIWSRIPGTSVSAIGRNAVHPRTT